MQVCSVSGAHDADVNSVAWHPTDAGLLASGGDDGRVRLWRLRGGAGARPGGWADGAGGSLGGGGRGATWVGHERVTTPRRSLFVA